MNEIDLRNAVTRLREVWQNAREEQEQLLARILRSNAQTEFGKRYGFENITDGWQYSKTVPLSTYQDYDASILRIVGGEQNILTADPPVFYNISAGSTGEPKYIHNFPVF